MASSAKPLVRVVTAGSVDDGKSTLIGRLLHDSKSLMQDQQEAIAKARFARGSAGELDLSFATDGLEAEREQGITIDVAYRYCATDHAAFILVDAPGHEAYTRNMVTGASQADVAVILVDVSRLHGGGLKVQTRRHATLASLLGLKVVFAVNKMDLVDWSEAVFLEVSAALMRLARALDLGETPIIPIDARAGHNVVARGVARGVAKGQQGVWYHGPSLLQVLEGQSVQRDLSALPVRFPVQRVARYDGATANGRRGYQGRLASGRLCVGDLVAVLPSGAEARIAALETYDQSLITAPAGLSLTVFLDRELDVSRGSVIAGPDARTTTQIVGDLCWLDDTPWSPTTRYWLRQGTSETRARITDILHVRDMVDLTEISDCNSLALNDIALVRIQVQTPILTDAFADNPRTGAFILIDPVTHQTVAAGMIRETST